VLQRKVFLESLSAALTAGVFNALLAVVMYVGYEVVIDELEQDDELHEFDSELCVTFDLTLVVSSVLPILMLLKVFESLSFASTIAPDVGKAVTAASRLISIIDRIPAVDATSTSGQKLHEVAGRIDVVDVDFWYPTGNGVYILQGYDLSIAAGQMVALCGPSGSGKSTIVSLLERFYDPCSGTVLLDGVDLRQLNVAWLRQQLGLVGQEPVLFLGSISDNIRQGKREASQAEVEHAAISANAHEFISTLTDRYDTQVGFAGGKLSGGQKQRIAIARAIVRSPTIFLLDEATSALDTRSERVVQQALDKIIAEQKRTTVVIAHRLSTIRNADAIAMVEKGKVVEKGSHEELMALNGLYSNFSLAQM